MDGQTDGHTHTRMDDWTTRKYDAYKLSVIGTLDITVCFREKVLIC